MTRVKSVRNQPKCTPVEFDEAIVLFSLDPVTIARVRRVLVDGIPPPVVAQEDGISTQMLHRQYTKVLKKILEHRTPHVASEVIVPEGWQSVTIIAPPEFIATIKKQLADYLNASGASPST